MLEGIPILSLDDIYLEYREVGDFKFISSMFIKLVDEQFKGQYIVDYQNVYPIIKNISFGLDEAINFITEDLFLDLKIMFVEDQGDVLRYISKEDDINKIQLRKSAFDNLSGLEISCKKLENNLEVYSLTIFNDFSVSIILLDRVQELIKKKIGTNYMLAIPSSSAAFFAPDKPLYRECIEKMIKLDPNPYKVSDRVYRCSNSQFKYNIDKSSILRVI